MQGNPGDFTNMLSLAFNIRSLDGSLNPNVDVNIGSSVHDSRKQHATSLSPTSQQ